MGGEKVIMTKSKKKYQSLQIYILNFVSVLAIPVYYINLH